MEFNSLEEVRNHAMFLKEHSPEDIRHIVYEIKYYVPVPEHNGQLNLIYTHYLIDMCTDEEFNKTYRKASLSPLIYVGAVHKP